jgi:hypothetical protein
VTEADPFMCQTDWCKHCGGADYRHKGEGPQKPRPVPLMINGRAGFYMVGCPGFELAFDLGMNPECSASLPAQMTNRELEAWYKR